MSMGEHSSNAKYIAEKCGQGFRGASAREECAKELGECLRRSPEERYREAESIPSV